MIGTSFWPEKSYFDSKIVHFCFKNEGKCENFQCKRPKMKYDTRSHDIRSYDMRSRDTKSCDTRSCDMSHEVFEDKPV